MILTEAVLSTGHCVIDSRRSACNMYSCYAGVLKKLDLLYTILSAYLLCNFFLPHTCCSIRPLSGLITIPIAFSLLASGPRNIHRLFPDPVATRTKTSFPCMAARDASNCPGRNLEYPKHFTSTLERLVWQGQGVLPLQGSDISAS